MLERWFPLVKKMIPPIRIVDNVFFIFFYVWEKWYVQSEDIKVCEFHAKIPPFYRRLQLTAPFAALIRSLSTRKVFLEEFLIKKWKASLKLEWNSFVCFTFGEENCREPTKQQQKRKKRTAVSLCYAFYWSYFVFYLHVTLIIKAYIQTGHFFT